MFEIPADNDNFWDEDFPFEEEIPATEMRAKTTKSSLSVLRHNGLLSNAPDHEPEQKVIESPNISFTKIPGNAHVKRCQRKFPGPAGILPPSIPSNQPNIRSSDSPDLKSLTESPGTPHLNDKAGNLTMSQTPPEDIFASLHWKTVMEDLGPEAQTIINKFSIKSMLLKASRKLLHRGKIPLLIGVLENLDLQGSDASFVIRDLSGKMNGSLHRDLIKDPTTALEIGSVLVLRQVSVISPSSRTHYLNVTPGNVVLIYSNKKNDVLKRAWPTSPTRPVSRSEIKDSPSLKQVIEESEHELNTSMRNFNQRLLGSSAQFSASTSNISRGFSRGGHGSSLFSPYRPASHGASPRFGSSLSNPNSSVSSRTRGTYNFQRPRVPNANSNFSHQASSEGLLFPSKYQSKDSNNSSSLQSSSIQNKHSSTSSNSIQGYGNVFKETQLTRPVDPALHMSTSNFIISGAKAVRNSSSLAGNTSSNCSQSNSKGTSSLPAQYHQTKSLNTKNSGLFLNSSNINTDTNRNQKFLLDTAGDFVDDFPFDEDDHEILQLCDSALSQSDNTQEAKSDQNNIGLKADIQANTLIAEDNDSLCSVNVIDQLFSNEKDFDEQELGIKPAISSSISSCNITRNQGLVSGEKINMVSSTLATTASSQTKCTFKRPASCLESSSILSSAKRKVDQLKSDSVSTIDAKFDTRQKLSEVNTNSVSARDARIQLGRSASVTMSKNRDVQDSGLLPHWDEDLNDDLLSQLSDDF